VASGALAWLLTQVKTIAARTPTAITSQVVDETDFTKFLILSNIVSPFYYLSQFPTPFFSVLINIFMKSFKQFLTEMESSDPTDSSQRNIVPPGSIPPPKMPAPTRLDPGSLPPGHDRPDDQGNPGDIDWQDVDEEIQGLLRLFEQLMQLMGTIPWDQFVEYMRRVYGVNVPLNDRYDVEEWFRVHGRQSLKSWFEYHYPNHTEQQWFSFIERLYGQYGLELWKIYDRETIPSDVPENETPQEGPSERDRERARERWEREHY
jgi:hypothetical protein